MLPENITACLAHWAAACPDRLAIVDREYRISYSQFGSMVEAMAGSLQDLGIGRGDLALTFMPNHYQLMVTFYALNRLGATCVPCTSGYKTAEVTERMKKTPPKIAFCFTEEQASAVKAVDPNCLVVKPEANGPEIYDFDSLLSHGDGSKLPPLEDLNKEDVGLIIYSSGTTGDPKGVQLSFDAIYGSAREIARRLAATGEDIFMMPLPLCHLFGIINGLLTPIYVGGTIVLMDRFDPDKCLDLAERERATVIYGVPTMFSREILKQKEQARDLVPLRTGVVAGALSSPQLIRDIRDVLGCEIMVAYGMSEMVVISMTDLTDSIEKRANSVGTPYRGIEVKCVNGDGETLQPGQIGELLARGFARMKGYYGRPDLDKELIDEDGWVHSGDIVRIDEDGYIHICGRIKDIIIRGGRNILPVEVEKLYHNHPGIEQISVVGSPDPEMGEKTVAYVKLVEGAQEDEASIRKYAKEQAIGYKTPDRVIILKEFPLLPNGKIDRKALKAMAKTIE